RLARPLLERRRQIGCGLEDETFGRADHAVDDASFKQLASLADEMPAVSGEPCAVMQRIEKPFRVRAVLNDKKDMLAGGWVLLAGLAVDDIGAGRAPPDMAGARDFGADGRERSGEPAELFNARLDGVGHALDVEVEQDEGRAIRLIDEIVRRSRDEAG